MAHPKERAEERPKRGAPSAWGRRLSDAIRLALDAGDGARARRLALEGDGQARSLEKEYALMYRGLGITVRILLGLGRKLAVEHPGPEDAAVDLAGLLRRFRNEMTAAMTRAYSASETGRALDRFASQEAAATTGAGVSGAAVDVEVALTDALLGAGEDLFRREQARLAAETVEAIDAGDFHLVRRLLDLKERGQYVPLHDRIVRFMAEIFAWVLARFGPEELQRFHHATAEGQREGFESWERLPAVDFAAVTAFLLRQHMGTVDVREDAERFTLVQTPCGSGGRLRLAGVYAGPDALPFVEGPSPLTVGGPRMPVYCTHCMIWNGLATIGWFGRPHWVFDDPSRADGSCTMHIYKRRDGAPADYALKLGVAGPAG